MSSSDLAISVRGLSKAYTIRHNQTDHVTLAEVALDRLRHPLRRAEREQFWALRDVEFDVRQGEVLGVIGRNGAGKSTLLKVLSRITDPTAGEVRLWGRVGSLLEVGTGFHPELTGRENIYLNGSILGMSRKEIDRHFDEIVEFAGVEQFLDTPVKRYSSGMYVRLAFAVAAHLDSEILILDEVLAVGDADFQKKALGKVSDVAESGRTVLLVSHSMSNIRTFCSAAILLKEGRLDASGTAEAIISTYESSTLTTSASVADTRRPEDELGKQLRITSVELEQRDGILSADSPIRYSVEVVANEDLRDLRIGTMVSDAAGARIASTFSDECINLLAGTTQKFAVEIPSHPLAPGRYRLTINLGRGGLYATVQNLDVALDCLELEISPPRRKTGEVAQWQHRWFGYVNLPTPSVELRAQRTETARTENSSRSAPTRAEI